MKEFIYFKRFFSCLFIGIFLLILTLVLTLSFGASHYHLKEISEALTFFSKENFHHTTIRDIRLPRWIADVIVGASLSVSGTIMQGTTRNPMADSGLMGIASGSTLGIVIVMTFFPNAGRFERMGISAIGAIAVTLLIYAIATLGKGRMNTQRLVLSGMAISTLLSSLTTAIVLKYGLSNQMLRYTSGSSANVIWKDIYISLPIFLFSIFLSILIARFLTAMNLGEEISISLGVNRRLVVALATVIVLSLSSVAVIMIGPVGYVGLMVPYFARYIAGTDYRYILPLSAIYGANFVCGIDLLSKLIRPGKELPIGLLITMIGVPFFVYISRKKGGEWYL